MVRRAVVIGVALAALIGGGAGCGGGHTSRDKRACETCNVGANPECFDQCRMFCVPNDPNCDARCTAQCDHCRRDLLCGACVADCTGTTTRCAPTNATVVCDDGTYGGSLPAPAVAAP